ncbi:unnamed protein product [Nezara viridula]|uniref:Pacifastin domain-containing protein n=1 Tax=Nezara viridula TaxID=85310 RepID=A0A9P0EG10_NEZVI|nr:unnamed protein product [Nezara viridula]
MLYLLVYFVALAVASPIISKFTGSEQCSPGDLIWVDCNLCTCNLQGKPNLICAKMWCQPQPKEKNSIEKELM